MKCFQTCLFVCYVSAASAADNVRRQALAHLRAAPATTKDVETEIRAAFSSLFSATPPSFSNGTQQEVGSQVADGDKKKQPTHMQVPQEEVDQFMANLSSTCQTQFKQILLGKGPALHTFGNKQDADVSEAACTKLEGKICYTRALVQQQKVHGQRDMKSVIDVTGDSCLPNKCAEEKDLSTLAKFMLKKAKEQVGVDTKIGLHVDCSKSDGAMVDIGSYTDALAATKATTDPISGPNSAAAPVFAHIVGVVLPLLLLLGQ